MAGSEQGKSPLGLPRLLQTVKRLWANRPKLPPRRLRLIRFGWRGRQGESMALARHRTNAITFWCDEEVHCLKASKAGTFQMQADRSLLDVQGTKEVLPLEDYILERDGPHGSSNIHTAGLSFQSQPQLSRRALLASRVMPNCTSAVCLINSTSRNRAVLRT